MFWSGARVGETAALALGDLDTAARRLHIRSGKGGKRGSFTVPPAAAPDLLSYLFSQPDAAGAVYLWSAGNGAGGATNSACRRCKAAGMVTIIRTPLIAAWICNGNAQQMAAPRWRRTPHVRSRASPEITRRFYADYLDEDRSHLQRCDPTLSGPAPK